ncbi:MAG: hypothetical protein WC683_04285 [bacterium]
MKRVLVAVCILALSGCTGWWLGEMGYDPQFESIPHPVSSTIGGDATPEGIGKWLGSHIRRSKDIERQQRAEYWAPPDLTWLERSGDCEDIALLMMYLIRWETGEYPSLATGIDGDTPHAWVIFGGRWYEAQGGADVTDSPERTLWRSVPYGEAMYRSMNGHKGLAHE